MATQKVVIEGSSVSASQLKELFKQIAKGGLDGEDLQAFLEHRNPWPRPPTVTLGLHKTADAYEEALKKLGANLNSCEIAWGALEPAQEPITLNLAYVTVEELGFKTKVSYSEICQAALQRGLQLCPLEVGPALRLILKKRSNHEWICVGMQPDLGDDPEDEAFVYSLGTENHMFTDEEDKYILSVRETRDEEKFHTSTNLVFIRP